MYSMEVKQESPPAVAPVPVAAVAIPGEDVKMKVKKEKGDVEMTEKRASTRILEQQAKKAAQDALKKEREEEAKRKREESRKKKEEREEAKKEKAKEKEAAQNAVKKEKAVQKHENFKKALETHAGPLLKEVYHEARQELLLAKIPKRLKLSKKRGRSESSSKSASSSMDSEEKGRVIDEIMIQRINYRIDKQIEHLEREKHKLEEKLIEFHEKLRENMKYLHKDSKTPVNDKFNAGIKSLKEPFDDAIKKLRGLRHLALGGIKHKEYGQAAEQSSSGLAEGMQTMFNEAPVAAPVAAPAVAVAAAPMVAAPVAAPMVAAPEQTAGRKRRGGCGCAIKTPPEYKK